MADDPEKGREAELAQSQMTFGEHLGELRGRLVKSLITSVAGLAVVFIFHEQVFALVINPYRVVMEGLQEDPALTALGPTQAFFAHIKVSFIVGLILTAPIWVHQIWMFIGAGLYGRERLIIYKFAPLCLILFLAGVLFGYFVLIPLGLEYLLTFADKSMVKTAVTIPEYLKFFTLLTLLLGVAFELPVVMLGMVKAGVITPAKLREKRKWALILIFVMAALFTPPDPVTQVLLALPLIALYQFGIFLGWLSLGKNRPSVDWSGRWKLARAILILGGILFLFRSSLSDMWSQQLVGGNLFDASRAESPPVASVGQELLGISILGAYRISEEETGGRGQIEQSWVLRVKERCYVVALSAQRVDHQVVDRSQATEKIAWVDFHHFPQPQVRWRMKKLPAIPFGRFIPELLEGLRVGDDDVRAETKAMLALLSGKQPEGDGEEALSVFAKWYEGRSQERLLQ